MSRKLEDVEADIRRLNARIVDLKLELEVLEQEALTFFSDDGEIINR